MKTGQLILVSLVVMAAGCASTVQEVRRGRDCGRRCRSLQLIVLE